MSKQLETINNDLVDDFEVAPDELTMIQNLISYFNDEQFLAFRRRLVTWIMGKDPVIMNVTLTSDIIEYNKLDYNPRCIMEGNIVKRVSEQTSFIYGPSNTTYTK